MPIETNVRFCTSTNSKIDIAYEEFGNPEDHVILLVPGFRDSALAFRCAWPLCKGKARVSAVSAGNADIIYAGCCHGLFYGDTRRVELFAGLWRQYRRGGTTGASGRR